MLPPSADAGAAACLEEMTGIFPLGHKNRCNLPLLPQGGEEVNFERGFVRIANTSPDLLYRLGRRWRIRQRLAQKEDEDAVGRKKRQFTAAIEIGISNAKVQGLLSYFTENLFSILIICHHS